ncbi:hypothetical protein ONE63_009562 [Megalurothrips usitatus]|uniref:Uncharacterized protein n=1 Tax=Megalurothrips usitatus TaxID=439358 RepID=A0AAV7XMK3_9NEOP|nr:hypothetical protein ONE63_009562 [Megalurothrips usitatus]
MGDIEGSKRRKRTSYKTYYERRDVADDEIEIPQSTIRSQRAMAAWEENNVNRQPAEEGFDVSNPHGPLFEGMDIQDGPEEQLAVDGDASLSTLSQNNPLFEMSSGNSHDTSDANQVNNELVEGGNATVPSCISALLQQCEDSYISLSRENSSAAPNLDSSIEDTVLNDTLPENLSQAHDLEVQCEGTSDSGEDTTVRVHPQNLINHNEEDVDDPQHLSLLNLEPDNTLPVQLHIESDDDEERDGVEDGERPENHSLYIPEPQRYPNVDEELENQYQEPSGHMPICFLPRKDEPFDGNP